MCPQKAIRLRHLRFSTKLLSYSIIFSDAASGHAVQEVQEELTAVETFDAVCFSRLWAPLCWYVQQAARDSLVVSVWRRVL